MHLTKPVISYCVHRALSTRTHSHNNVIYLGENVVNARTSYQQLSSYVRH